MGSGRGSVDLMFRFLRGSGGIFEEPGVLPRKAKQVSGRGSNTAAPGLEEQWAWPSGL